MGRFALSKLLGSLYASGAAPNLDYHVNLEITPDEAARGAEKPVSFQRGGQSKRLMVKIPGGVKSGTKIRLKDMGKVRGGKAGNLYLHVRIGE